MKKEMLYLILSASILGNVAFASHRVPNYVVQSGETLSDIAVWVGYDMAALMRLNHLSQKSLMAGQKIYLPTAQEPNYVVRNGDTLSDLAVRVGYSILQIKQWNHLRSEVIQVGQKIYLPKPRPPREAQVIDTYRVIRYMVRDGDTLGAIASQYGVTINAIYNYNKLQNMVISVGQYLDIPQSVGLDCKDACVQTPVKAPAVSKPVVWNVSDFQKPAINTQPSQPPVVWNTVDYQTGVTVHTVKDGETLAWIARRYGTTIEALVILNNIIDANDLVIGTRIRLK